MQRTSASWLLDGHGDDDRIAALLRDDPNFDDVDAADLALTTSFMRAIALFDHALVSGQAESANRAREQLVGAAEAARALNAVSHWWTATLASHLLDDLWRLSLHQQIPILPAGDPDESHWNQLRRRYIQRLRSDERAAIELWPSQLSAASRAVDASDDLVVSLPTSAGKTRIAELCILRALAAKQRVVYVTPLRALSAQVQRDLSRTFSPLGFFVSSLYGATPLEQADTEALRAEQVVVSTPEKLDFALRNDPSLLVDVGLVVLDEGHMLGPNEREVRYEALVQRLLRRADSSNRRIVCLSALFPAPSEMKDLVAWIRQDQSGDPIHSGWRPTRQRFGTIQWISDSARLDVKIENESPYVPRFIEARAPTPRSRRRNSFPANKNELTLATAWRFVEQGKDVLLYCSLRASVETLGKLVLQCVRQGLLNPLREIGPRTRNAIATGTEWLGKNHPAVACLRHGVALHHGGLPRPFLSEVEGALSARECPLAIASPTLAQGVNLSASVLLVPSIWRNRSIIPATEFANVAGRAGRAFVDLEGLILHVVHERNGRERQRRLKAWESLVAAARAPRVRSGLLVLAEAIYERIRRSKGLGFDEVVDYLNGHSKAWDFEPTQIEDITQAEWERDIASLDSSILALVESDTPPDDIDIALDSMLEGSLFSRQLAEKAEAVQECLRRFVALRARHIWSLTSSAQRRGYHLAGVGLRAGQFLDTHLSKLVKLLIDAEDAVVNGDGPAAATHVVGFAAIVFQTEPFRFSGTMPSKWRDALSDWIKGGPTARVLILCGKSGVLFFQDAITYRLPWAMEAVRVHAVASGHIGAEALKGLTAMAVEAGSAKPSVVLLIRSGLDSREAALAAVASTGASFKDRAYMLSWLRSDVVKRLSLDEDWPTADSHHAWLRFLGGEGGDGDRGRWRAETLRCRVAWDGPPPPPGTSLVVEPEGTIHSGGVFTPDYVRLGTLKLPLKMPRTFIGAVRACEDPGHIEIEVFAPRASVS